MSTLAVGCGQCHEQENTYGRMKLGEMASDVTFEYFARQVYEHTEKYPTGRRGNYSRQRLPEAMLREIYTWTVKDLGLRASVGAMLAIADRQPDQTRYTLNVVNRGVKGKGLAVEGVTVFVRLPPGATVTQGAGTGYAGVMPLAQLNVESVVPLSPAGHGNGPLDQRPAADRSGQAAVWRIPKLNAADTLQLSLTLAGPLTGDTLKGFAGSTIHWDRPGRTPAGRPPVLMYRDLKFPDVGDHERIALPHLP